MSKFVENKNQMFNSYSIGNYLVMINLATVQHTINPILKQNIKLKLKGIQQLERVNIFAMPSRIKDRDISAMFNGLLALLKEKVQQEQSEKYLRLKLKYSRLQYLYNLTKNQLAKLKTEKAL